MIDLKKQIEGIIEDLGNDESISKILLKAQAIAFYLKDDTFTDWIKAEQNGYKSAQNLPDYRKIHCTIQVDVSFPFRGILYGIDFPTDAVENDLIREELSHMCFCDSVFMIGQLGNDKENGLLKMNASTYTYKYIKKHFPDGNIEGVHKITNTSSAKAIIDSVKSKLLEFFLIIEEQIDLNVNFDVMANKEKIQSIVNQTINAGVVNAGNGNISITSSEIIGGDQNVSISSTNKKELTDIIERIEEINKRYNDEDLSNEITVVKDDLAKPTQNPKFIKRAFNAMKGISIGIMANELTPIIDQGIELLNNML